MRLTWNSKYAGNTPQVKYTVNGQAYTIPATSYTYTADDLCGYPAKSQGWRDPGYFHTAIIKVGVLELGAPQMLIASLLQGLRPGQDSVTYSYGSDAYGYSEPKVSRVFGSSMPVMVALSENHPPRRSRPASL